MSGDQAWTFARRFYARPGVSAALLRLQDDHGVDIPLLLVLLAMAASGRSLDAAAIGDLARQAGEVQRDVVAPLRQARRALGRYGDENLYARVKDLELAAEEAIIRRLGDQSACSADTSAKIAAIANLDGYRRLARLVDDAFDAVLTAFIVDQTERMP